MSASRSPHSRSPRARLTTVSSSSLADVHLMSFTTHIPAPNPHLYAPEPVLSSPRAGLAPARASPGAGGRYSAALNHRCAR